MGIERRSRRRPGENRARLMEAGLIEFGLFGYHGTSTARIAQRAEVPQPHVYANFRTKQELFVACLVSASRTLLAQQEHAAPEPLDAGHGARKAAERLLYQAVAIARDTDLGEPISTALTPLRSRLGETAFTAMLSRAGAGLLPALD